MAFEHNIERLLFWIFRGVIWISTHLHLNNTATLLVKTSFWKKQRTITATKKSVALTYTNAVLQTADAVTLILKGALRKQLKKARKNSIIPFGWWYCLNGVYIHIPFCKSKCPYCDFYSYRCKSEEREKYIDSLIDEINTFPSSTVG